jgi:regulatory protein
MTGRGKKGPKKLDREALFDYAVKTLGARALSMGELRVRLSRKAEAEGDIGEVMGKLKEYGYLDDRRFAETFAASRLENQGFGRHRVLRDLRQRRVAPAVAEKAVAGAFEETDEVELIEAYLKRKYRKVNLGELLRDPAKLAAAYRKLRYAGFSGGNAIRALKRYSELADELEGMEEG